MKKLLVVLVSMLVMSCQQEDLSLDCNCGVVEDFTVIEFVDYPPHNIYGGWDILLNTDVDLSNYDYDNYYDLLQSGGQNDVSYKIVNVRVRFNCDDNNVMNLKGDELKIKPSFSIGSEVCLKNN